MEERAVFLKYSPTSHWAIQFLPIFGEYHSVTTNIDVMHMIHNGQMKGTSNNS